MLTKNFYLQCTCLVLLFAVGSAELNAQWARNKLPVTDEIVALIINDADIYAATSTNGVFLSTDNGTRWISANRGLTDQSIYAFVKSGKNLLLGTNKGVFLSKNNGSNWLLSNKGLPPYTTVTSFNVTGTMVYAGTAGDGFFLSTDNGNSWNALNSSLNKLYAWSLAVNSNIFFAGTHGYGIFRSTNNGVRWITVNYGLSNMIVNALVVNGTNLFAGTSGDGVFRSIDNASSWVAANSSLADLHVFTLAVSGKNLFAGTANGVFVSSNNGSSWREFKNNSPTQVRTLATSSTNLFAGDMQGNLWSCAIEEISPAPSLPPSLAAQVSFTEPSGNGMLDAEEQGKIIIRVTNSGKGDAYGLEASVEPSNSSPNTAALLLSERLSLKTTTEIGDIRSGQSKTVEIPIAASHDVPSGKVSLVLKFSEANGFEPSPTKIELTTKAFAPPKLIVADVGVEDANGGSIIQPGKVVTVTARIQNTGIGDATDVKASIRKGENVFFAEDSKTDFYISNLGSGEYKDIKFSVYTNNRATDVPVFLDLTEHYGSYGASNIKLPLAFNKPMARLNEIVVQPKEQAAASIEVAKGLSIDVDTNIPQVSSEHNPNAVALILSISDYQVSGIPSVKYAKNDAEVLRQYLVKALGFKPENILPANSDEQLTYGRIQTYIKSILPSYLKPDGSSDLFIYYTGHGAPSTTNHEAYLVPWDGDPNYVNDNNSYSIKKFYLDVELLNARHKTIVIDACFSGQAGNGATLIQNASPALLRVNNPLVADANTVIFQSSSANQVSNWYDEKRHGMFTYFFLKGLQGAADANNDGKITADELIKFINDANDGLPYYSNRLYQRPQEAQMEGNRQTVIERIEK